MNIYSKELFDRLKPYGGDAIRKKITKQIVYDCDLDDESNYGKLVADCVEDEDILFDAIEKHISLTKDLFDAFKNATIYGDGECDLCGGDYETIEKKIKTIIQHDLPDEYEGYAICRCKVCGNTKTFNY